VGAARAKEFKHPGEIPIDDEAAAKACFDDMLRGPSCARLDPAMLVQTKGNVCMIAENGATREVPKCMVVHRYEGLLILQELEAAQGQPNRLQASWWDNDLKEVLERERSNLSAGRLNGAAFVERRMLNVAVTGHRFIDSDDREWNFRRDNVRLEDKSTLVQGEDSDTSWRIKAITGYLPPWEALFHNKCGFYQDFYQVRWEHPYSEVDYSGVENGCAAGSTWEPDECVPAHLDPLRLAAKREWIRRKREALVAAGTATAARKEAAGDAGAPPPKRARRGRDGAPLDQDLFQSSVGHDFAPEEFDKTMGHVCSGWPKVAGDYPAGFAVASPPGFCRHDCDCMDDQRAQQPWELVKSWLDDQLRFQAVGHAMRNFEARADFVRRRGTVSRQCYFETAQGQTADLRHAQAAADLAAAVERAIKAVLLKVPVAALSVDPVRVPARAFLAGSLDYDVLSFRAATASGAPLPHWLRVDGDSGQVIEVLPPAPAELPLHIVTELVHAEGNVAVARCCLTFESSAGWQTATAPLVEGLGDPARCGLENGVRRALMERCAEVYDFDRGMHRDPSLGRWLDVMHHVLRLLRGAAGANLAFPPLAHASGRP